MELSTTVPTDFSLAEIFELDQENIFKYFISLNSSLISDFLDTKGIQKTGNKKTLIKRVRENLEDENITYYDLLLYLESIELYGKQHVILYNGPTNYVEGFRAKNSFMEKMRETDFVSILDNSLPVTFPRDLQIASIIYSENEKLEIYAVEAHYHLERLEEKDNFETVNGQEIEFRAHARSLRRGIVVFRWNLVVNNAILQILQLPRGYSYEKMENRFADSIHSLIDLNLFEKVDLSSVISKLHELEETENPETRSHGLGYKTFGGRSVSAYSSTDNDNLLGSEEFIDSALSDIREDAIGHIGNFYWVPSDEENDNSDNEENVNPLNEEIRTVILAGKKRINFSTPHDKEELEYVIRRVRELSQ